MPKSFFRHLGLHVTDLVLASRLGLAPTSLIWYQSLGCLVAMYVLECATVCVRRVGILVPKPGTARGASFWTPPPTRRVSLACATSPPKVNLGCDHITFARDCNRCQLRWCAMQRSISQWCAQALARAEASPCNVFIMGVHVSRCVYACMYGCLSFGLQHFGLKHCSLATFSFGVTSNGCGCNSNGCRCGCSSNGCPACRGCRGSGASTRRPR